MYKTISNPLLKQYAVIVTANLLTLCVGMDVAWSSPMLIKLRDPEMTPLSRLITEDEVGWIVSIGFIFSIFTIPFIGLLMDYIGRRYVILLTCLPKILAGGLTIFATEVWMLLVARTIYGVTSTAAMMIIMVYCTEISSKEIRGSLGSLQSIICNLGVVMMLGIGPYISYLNLSIMITAVAVCVSIPLLFIPDTPYSLYKRGKIEEAKEVLVFLRESQTLAEEELSDFIQTKPIQKFNAREILRNKAYLKALIIVVALGLGVQMIGFNFVSFYLQPILQLTNTSVSPAIGSVVIGIIQVASSISAGLIVDRFGRRPILISTLVAKAVGMIGLGIFFMLKQKGVFISGFLNYLPLICIAIVTICYSAGIGCLYFVITSEILDDPIRALFSSISAIASYTSVSLLTLYAMNILSFMGPNVTFFMFGSICIMMSLFVYFFVPETKQKSIAEIQRALGGLKEDGENTEYVTRF